VSVFSGRAVTPDMCVAIAGKAGTPMVREAEHLNDGRHSHSVRLRSLPVSVRGVVAKLLTCAFGVWRDSPKRRGRYILSRLAPSLVEPDVRVAQAVPLYVPCADDRGFHHGARFRSSAGNWEWR